MSYNDDCSYDQELYCLEDDCEEMCKEYESEEELGCMFGDDGDYGEE